MKQAKFLFVAALAASLIAFPAYAGPTGPDTAKPVALPKVIKVVHPTNLPPSFAGAHVQVTFLLDSTGVPHDVAPVGSLPNCVTRELLPAVAQWRFTPLYRNGQPVPTRVVLPLQLVDASRIAAN